MNAFGSGPSLRHASRQLKDPDRRHRAILDVVERNSVIEGLPPLSKRMRTRLRAGLKRLA